VTEIASGLNDSRPKLLKLLTDLSIPVLVVEHRDRLTRFGFTSIEQLMQTQGRHREVISATDRNHPACESTVEAAARHESQ
jgi:putative resolvase